GSVVKTFWPFAMPAVVARSSAVRRLPPIVTISLTPKRGLVFTYLRAPHATVPPIPTTITKPSTPRSTRIVFDSLRGASATGAGGSDGGAALLFFLTFLAGVGAFISPT